MNGTDRFTGFFASTGGSFILPGFGFADQPASHIVFFAIAVLFLRVSVAAAIMAALDKRQRFRFAWSIGCFVGIGKGVLIWSRGEPLLYPVSIQIPTLMIVSAPQLGYVVLNSIPLFALIYLVNRYRRGTIALSHRL